MMKDFQTVFYHVVKIWMFLNKKSDTLKIQRGIRKRKMEAYYV